MRFWILNSLLLSSTLIYAQQKQVCFTIDDLPVVAYGNSDPFYQWDVTLNLISKFDKHKIPAIGFVNEGKLYRDDQLDSTQLDLLKMWFQNGYEIGNHTYSHMSYHKASLDEFKEEILKGEKISRHLEQEYNKELTYFRHPYLHIGETEAKYDSLNQLLKELNYTVAPVTISNEDWVFASAYARAEKENKELMSEIGEAYIQYTLEKVQYAERMSEGLFGRQISQTMLLHSNKLNADYMDELAAMFEENGYMFISLDKALEDKAYQGNVTQFFEYGRSWLEHWATTASKPDGFYEGYPKIPDWIENPN